MTYGDVNSDGKISILDMILLKSYITEKNTEGFSVKAADLDGDGTVSAKDAVELCMFLLNQTGSFSYEMNVDTDGDGLCDYVEKEILGTDYLKADTDGDGLDDYSEVYLCDTDPLNADTGKTGVKDSAKDADGDKLTNAEEIKLGTSPALTDTDEDGLSDYDEVKKYKTDPLKEDTDGDGVSDNGEIKLELDPLNVKSDGKTFDAERTFEQKISSDNDMLKIVNNEDSPYQLSISSKSSGYINEAVSVDISAYSNYLQNDAVAGDIIDIDYVDDFKIESMKINFSVSENAERYYIFRYFEDVNMLLPVETLYDGNNIYTDCTEDGTYCLVDMDIWSGISAISEVFQSANVIYNAAQVFDIARAAGDEEIEVYFIMYASSENLDNVKSSVNKASQELIDYCNKKSKSVKLYYSSYNSIISLDSEKKYLDNNSSDDDISDTLALLKSPPLNKISLSGCPIIKRLNDTWDNYGQKTSGTKYYYIINAGTNPPLGATEKVSCPANPFDPDYYKWQQFVEMNPEFKYYDDGSTIIIEGTETASKAETMTNGGAVFNVICNKNNVNISKYKSIFLPSGKDVYYLKEDFSDCIFDEIAGDDFTIAYNVNTGLCNEIPYDDSLITSEWKDIYEKFDSGKLSIDEVKKLGLPDTDGDGTPDCLEIFMKYISFDSNGNIILPTYDELAKDALKNSAFGLKGLDNLAEIMKKKGIDISDLRILPLISNPAAEDCDFDGIDDCIDDDPVNSASTEIEISNIDDSNIFNDINRVNSLNNGDGKIEYVNLYGSDSIKKPVITYTRYPNLRKRTLIRFEMLYSKYYSDFKITIDSLNKNNYDIYVYPVDGGTSLPVKSTVESNKSIYEFSTLTNNNGIERYIPFGLSEDSVPKWLISSVTPSWKYYVDIYVTPDKTIFDLANKNEVKISFEENNWFYAPHGGIATSDVFDYSALYLTDEALEVLANGDGFENWNEFKSLDKKIFSRKLREILTYYFFEEDECGYLSFGNKGFEYTVISDIATVSTFVGFVCLIGSVAIPLEKIQSALSILGNTSTTTGAIFTLYSPRNIEQKEFADITESCLYTVNRNSINIAMHNYDKFDSKGERYNCQEWLNNGYINKYYYAGISDAYRIIRATDFKAF